MQQHNGSEIKRWEDLFADPPAEFRGAPFWAWNTDLSESELLRQIDCFKEMGFGGFFIHTRAGMSTEYLGEEFMRLVRACNKKAKQSGMYSYLYDEDRWPSGFAGGYVTQDKAFRQKEIVISLTPPETMTQQHLHDEREPELLAAYDVCFDNDGRIKKYKSIAPSENAHGEKWYAYTLLKEPSGRFNGFTYADTLHSEAVDKFIDVTYEAYKRALGEEFGKSAPAIFTDEPQYAQVRTKAYARDGADAAFPWTPTLRNAFLSRFGYDIVEKMPEAVWERSDGKPATARYHLFMQLSETFASAYCDKIGAWCEKNGIHFTGHVLNESSLYKQTISVGEAMRQYRRFTVPGIDMLCNFKEFTTAKQAQSVAHQCGRRGMMSELYGVTGWEFDFRGHKFQGDWQAALGVTLRVPHLAWLSMRGSAKRDYPASIGCQSAWYKEYAYIEDHFARLNTALTRGKPVVRIAVIHPIESCWLTVGVREHTQEKSDMLDSRFKTLTEWLLRGQTDFDFVSESLLPELYEKSNEDFCVGEMRYKAVLVPPLETVRSFTLHALEAFAANGGKVLVCGNCPRCVDGKESNAAASLWQTAQKIEFSQERIAEAFETEREISVNGKNGARRKDLFYTLRQDGENRWLFIAHCDEPSRTDGADCAKDDIRIAVKGLYAAEHCDTFSGKVRKIACAHENGNTVLHMPCYPSDSFLFRLTPCAQETKIGGVGTVSVFEQNIAIPDFVEYALSEPNVLVLDMPEWSRDGVRFFPREEMLRIDAAVRRELGFAPANGQDVQPWKLSSAPPNHYVWLRFTVKSEIETSCELGYEFAKEVRWNGKSVPVARCGYFADKEIYTMPLPPLKKGTNELLVRAPLGQRVGLENMFLLGDFGVTAIGARARIVAPVDALTYDTLAKQGLPFYGANITYKIPFTCEAGDLVITEDYYIGALLGVRLDGEPIGKIVLPPYTLTARNVSAGKHTLELTYFGTRVNTFGALHCAAPLEWKGPNMWYTKDNMWSYEYRLQDAGVMKKPVLTLLKK